MGRWARAKFLASPATGPWLGKDVPGEGPEPAGAQRGARRCSAGSCAGAKQRLQRTQDVGRALGGGLGEGTRKGDFESCAGGGGRGEGGGWGRCSEERALTCLCAAAGGGGGAQGGGRAPDTCWGCEVRRPDAQSRAWLWEPPTHVAAAKCHLSPEKGFLGFWAGAEELSEGRDGSWDPAGPEEKEEIFALGAGGLGRSRGNDLAEAGGVVVPSGPHAWITLLSPSPGDTRGSGGQVQSRECVWE